MNCFIADIGGTNTRCAILRAGGRPEKIRAFRNHDFADPTALLKQYLASLHPDERPDCGAFAVAAPIRDDTVRMINIDWRFSAAELQEKLALNTLRILNDFEALAMALPELKSNELLRVGPGEIMLNKPKAVIGPGTGLGVAALIPVSGNWRPVGGEGGHVTLAASDEREAALIAQIRERFGHCSAERLLSGPGLSLLHATLHKGPGLSATEITELAESGDRNANQSLEMFFRLLGTTAADLALTLGAFGGVYIGGGIIPQHAEKFAASGFRQRFEAKGRYGNYLESVPTLLIISEHPTLTGLAAISRDFNA